MKFSDELFEPSFLSRLAPPDERGCRRWTKGKDRKGYGRCHTTDRGTLPAHRVSYELFNGEIPTGLMVCHRCDVRLCCEPSHLTVGTHNDNMADMVARKRQATGARHGFRIHPETAAKGEQNGQAKLTATMVLQLRAMEAQRGKLSRKGMAREIGIGEDAIRYALLGETWKHLPFPKTEDELMEALGSLPAEPSAVRQLQARDAGRGTK